jgi:hypothetical protein
MKEETLLAPIGNERSRQQPQRSHNGDYQGRCQVSGSAILTLATQAPLRFFALQFSRLTRSSWNIFERRRRAAECALQDFLQALFGSALFRSADCCNVI